MNQAQAIHAFYIAGGDHYHRFSPATGHPDTIQKLEDSLASMACACSRPKLASYFGSKTHSNLHHAWKKISTEIEQDELLRRRIQMARRNLES